MNAKNNYHDAPTVPKEPIRTRDNSNITIPKKQYKEHLDNLNRIGNHHISELCETNPELLVFPKEIGKYKDGIEDLPIFNLYFDLNGNGTLTTHNIMGFVGKNNTQLTISSRFEKPAGNDYFLHYMLQKVFAINLFHFDQNIGKESIWDFLLYLFPYYLKKAYSQGLYKAYRREEYNDSKIKGAIDVARHIHTNIPFVGKIAYNTRDHSHDNPVTQLIRHTIEHIKTHPFGSGVLNCDNDTRDIVNTICSVTQKRYARTERKQVVQANLKPVSHPYFTEYKPLQNICLQILRRDGLTFGLEKDKIYGLLFDGAWLWEEYLNTFLKELFLHSKNKEKKDGYPLFESKSQSIYPDFVKPNPESKSKMEMVADAKYSPLESTDTKVGEEKATRIYYKTITYMYRLKSKKGFLIYPFKNSEQTVKQDMYTIKGTDGTLTKIGMNIPQFANSFPKFCEEMKASEKQVLKVFGIQQNN